MNYDFIYEKLVVRMFGVKFKIRDSVISLILRQLELCLLL